MPLQDGLVALQRQHTCIRQHTSVYVRIRQDTSGYVRIRQDTSGYVSIAADVSIRQHTSAYVSIRQHTSAYVSIRQHTSGYVRIRQHGLVALQREHTEPTAEVLEQRPHRRAACDLIILHASAYVSRRQQASA